MGCTPSVLQSSGPEGGSTGGLVMPHNQDPPPTIGDSTGSPRAWRFRRARCDKNGAAAKNSSTISDRQVSDGKGLGLTKGQLKTPLKVLLAFSRDDAQSDALWTAADKLGCECNLARNQQGLLEAFQDKAHEIIIIDNRSAKMDGIAVCKALRTQKSSQHTLIAAVVKKSFTEKDEATVLQYLNAGYNRCIVESGSLGQCMNELLQLEGEVQLRHQFNTTQAFQLSLDKCKDVVHITDKCHQIQYANRASERAMGYSAKELVGKNILDIYHIDQKELMTQQLIRGREWEGVSLCKKKLGDNVVLNCRVIPVCYPGKLPTHYVFINDAPSLTGNKRYSEAAPNTGNTFSRDAYPPPRGSLHSIRKGSIDIKSIASDGTRRQSIAKLHSLSIEAPITRVITLIAGAQDSSSPQVVSMLDKVIDILRTTQELYSPVMKEDKVRTGDSVTNDLIGALLSQGSTPLSITRRSSNDSAASRITQTPGVRSTVKTANVSAQMRELLDSALLWEFNIFKLEELSQKRPLVYLGMNLMCHFDVPNTLGCDEATLHNWLVIIEKHYRATNTYHNSTHAADVLQASAGFLERERLKQIMDPLDEATCLIAAAAHDVDHPGKSSAFLCNSGDELAIMYNDICVLESHHSALAFKLTMSDERVNIFKGLERDVYKQARHSVIDMILATEMTRHYEHLAKFVNVFTKSASRDDDLPTSEVGSNSADLSLMSTPENIKLVKRMLIKCADVSNPVRPLRMAVEWARRIADEYFNQTDEEKANNLPVVMPMFDRATCSIPKSQIGFMDFIINDMMEAWEAIIEMPEILAYMQGNYKFWKEREEEGVTSIDELVMTQNSWNIKEETHINSSSIHSSL